MEILCLGNVDTLLQDYKKGIGYVNCAGNPGGNRFKKMVYSYDLISGKVNDVAYQAGWADQFYHRYNYDAENRLIEVRTSKDKIFWEREALYSYYRHGPLARTVLGQNQVQGIDYAYTLQGWLKGVNSTSDPLGGTLGSGNDCGANTAVNDLVVNQRLAPYDDYTARTSITFNDGFTSPDGDSFETFIEPALAACATTTGTAGDDVYGGHGIYDMGKDGLTNSAGSFVNTGTNLQTPDAYGFSLNYFSSDYKPISTAVTPFAALSLPLPADAGGITTGRQLFNGNIAAMAVSIPKLGDGRLYGYSYDQLNRIVRMNAFTGLNKADNSFIPAITTDYHEEISYDPNGNITTYLRNGTTKGGTPLSMDNLTYQYEKNASGQVMSNRLRYVHDQVADANYNEDINSQTALTLAQVQAEKSALLAGDNYGYDAIGNLTKDSKEGINNIDWTVYGKIKTITKTNDTTIKYTYDATGNRISKIVTTATTGDSTYYVRDASGNVMSVYNKKGALTLNQTELHLYGSSRLGVYNVNVDVQNCSGTVNPITTFTRGNKFFELSNHLGNVLATVSDKKIQHTVNNTTVDYYTADVVTANDYYAFGSQMPGRKYNQPNTTYRYGFNGKENDNEVKGEGNQQDYGMRIDDPRLGRFLSVDPLTKKYPDLTPYQFASNSSISGIDLDGLEFYYAADGAFIGSGFDPKNLEVRLAKITGKTPAGNIIISSVNINANAQKNWVVVHSNHDDFIKLASTAYGESSAPGYNILAPQEMNSIANINIRNPEKTAYAITKDAAIDFRNDADDKRTEKTGKRMAIMETIRALQGIDHSNGANAWDGAEQSHLTGTRFKEGGYESHAASQGWRIDNNKFDSWKSSIAGSVLGKDYFKAPQVSIGVQGLNKGKIRNLAVAQYGLSIFWRQSSLESSLSNPTANDSSKIPKTKVDTTIQ